MLIILKAHWHHFQFNCSGHLTVVVASGGGFFLACENYGGRLDESIPCMCFSFFQWRSAHMHQLYSRPGSIHSGSENWNNCGRAFPDELCMSLFSWWFPDSWWFAIYASTTYSAHSNFTMMQSVKTTYLHLSTDTDIPSSTCSNWSSKCAYRYYTVTHSIKIQITWSIQSKV